MIQRKPRSVQDNPETFKRYYDINPQTGCWIWKASLGPHGYGQLRRNRKCEKAHRYSYEMHTGKKIGRGMFACHSCDEPKCVNPDHIFEGSPACNASDMAKKGRGLLRGDLDGRVRVPCGNAIVIQMLCLDKIALHREIAAAFGTAESNVSRIASGNRRKAVGASWR